MKRLAFGLLLASIVSACGGDSGEEGTGGTSSATGGDAASTGGSSSVGGASTGGASSGGSGGDAGSSLCDIEFDAGPCMALIPVFWFDASAGECVERDFGGCGGNDNRFDTKEACEAMCSSGGVPSCEMGTDCTSCLALTGCSWTANQCSSQCLMDTFCFGAGNPAAPTCPN